MSVLNDMNWEKWNIGIRIKRGSVKEILEEKKGKKKKEKNTQIRFVWFKRN
jgi:hypothetical protein